MFSQNLERRKSGCSVEEKTPFSVLISTKNIQSINKIFLPYGHKFATEIFDPLSFFLKLTIHRVVKRGWPKNATKF